MVFVYACAFFHLCINHLFKSSCLSLLMSRSPVSLYLLLFSSWLLSFDLDCRWVGEGSGTPPQYSCLENPMDGGAWWAAVHGVAKSRKRLSNFTLTFHFHALEKEMATHSSVLAWRIPGTGEPGELPSMGRIELDTTEAP